MRKIFLAGFVLGVLTVLAALIVPQTVVVTANGQYGYYDSGDGYHYNGWFEPGVHFKAPWTNSFVIQMWNLSVPERAYPTKDGKKFYISFAVGGDFGNNVVGEQVNADFEANSRRNIQYLEETMERVVKQYTLDEILNPAPIPLFTPIEPGMSFNQDRFNELQKAMRNVGLHMSGMSASWGPR